MGRDVRRCATLPAALPPPILRPFRSQRCPPPSPLPQVLVNFGSSWCHHCHLLFPAFIALSKQFPKLNYAVAQVRRSAEGLEVGATARQSGGRRQA